MSDRPSDASADWRRRPRRGRGSPPPESSEQSGSNAGADEESPEETLDDSQEEIAASRTLFSFLEPGLDAIGGFAAPIVIAGIVGLIVGIVLVAFVPALRTYGFITLGFGVVLLVVIGLIYLSTVLSAFLSRTGRYGVNALIMLGAFIGIIVVINLIGFNNRSRIDVTATHQFSLATRTVDLLRNLNEPIKATAFYQNDPLQQKEDALLRRAKVDDTLSEFKNRSNRFTYEFKDPDLDPETARNYGVTKYESIVIEGQQSGVTDIIEPTDATYSKLEQDLYTGILVATGQQRKKVYFLAGHGEKSITNSAGDGYQSIRNSLERDNYEVDTLRWFPSNQDVTVPDDAALLVIAGPSGDLPDDQAKVLDAYLQGRNPDGSQRREAARLIFLAEQDTPDSFRQFLAHWGIVIDKGYIRDVDSSVPGSPQTLRQVPLNISRLPREMLAQVPPDVVQALQGITEPKGNPLGVVFMPGASSVSVINDQLRVLVPLASTSPNSYLIQDPNRTDPITEGDQADRHGQFLTAGYVRAVGPIGTPAPTSQPPDNQIPGMVVFGDSDFISNSFVERGSGSSLFLNSANYLLGDYSLVSIRDRKFVYREFNLDKNQLDIVRYTSWFLLPGLMGLMAALVWWVRR
jgi:ABC-type uncharacterized transport system involved in gliding motility auxiliary subunit